MTGLHSPWPLFGNDLDLARSWLHPQLRDLVSARIGHLAISLGLGDELLNGVQAGMLQADARALRQWRFRIARLHGETNPYRYLLPDGLFEQTLAVVAKNKIKGFPLGVQLNGGIGDHIEALSLLLPWAKARNFGLNLEMTAERQQQIEPLLQKWDQIRCNNNLEQRSASIPVMALRAVVASNAEPSQYLPWLTKPQTNKQRERDWLCCWRAEGAGDRLSAHSRSVPLTLVRHFYKHLQGLHPLSCIVDITKWKDWESRQLRDMGVKVLDPRNGTLLELVQLCRVSRVVTIDTALVHLCAAAGQRADLLLNAFPDERWRELLKPENHYGQLLQPWRSSEFGSWSAVMSSLTNSLTSED